jgi:hypothetical protein
MFLWSKMITYTKIACMTIFVLLLLVGGAISQNYNNYNSAQNPYDNYYAYGSNSFYSSPSYDSGYNPYSSNYNRNYNTPYSSNNYNSNYNNYPSNNPYSSGYTGQYSNRYPQTSSSYPDYYNRYDNGYNTYGSSVNPQFYPPGYSGFNYDAPSNFWSGNTNYQCVSGQDLILQIAPGGCQPSVVRSDLLEEQNVPVFCKLSALQVNPLIDVSRIRSIRVSGNYPQGVSGLSYYPARAAIGGKKVFENSIYDDNLGYVVIVLSRQPNESAMSESVRGNISAVVDYETEASFGMGDPLFYLSEISDDEWLNNYRDYGFWNGKGYIRVDNLEGDSATISVYRDVNSRQQTVTLRKGQTSSDIFLNGFYCAAGLRLYLEDLAVPRDSALVQINGVQTEVAVGDKILDNKCRVNKLETYGVGGKISISCPGKQAIELQLISGKAVFAVNEAVVAKEIGEEIANHVYLAYYGQDKDNKRYAILVKDDSTERGFKDKGFISLIEKNIDERASIKTIETKISGIVKKYDDKVLVGVVEENKEFSGVVLKEIILSEDKPVNYEQLNDKQKLSLDYYDLSASSYEELVDVYPQEKMEYAEEDPYAAQGLLAIAQLSRLLRKDGKAQEYYEKLINDYAQSSSAQTALFENRNLLKYDTTKAQASVSIANTHYSINLLDFKKPDAKNLNAVLSIDGSEHTLTLREKISIPKNNKVYHFRVVSIQDNYVDLEYDRDSTVKKQRIRKGEQLKADDVTLRLIETHSDKQVKLKILSRGYGPQVSSQFTFSIGIEKRALQTSPEQAKQSIKNLKETIATINDINAKLGSLISGMKAACFATSAVLSTKNMFGGGDSLGRLPVMTNSGGWNDKCRALVNEKKYQSVEQCILAHKDDIEKDVSVYTNTIQTTNKIITDINAGGSDPKQTEEQFKKTFEAWCKNQKESIALPNQEKTTLMLGDSAGSICSWDTLTHEQRRDIMVLMNSKHSGSDVLTSMTNTQLGKIGIEANTYHSESIDKDLATKEGNVYKLGIQTTNPVGETITQGYIKTVGSGDSSHTVYGKFTNGARVVRIFIPRSKVIGSQSFAVSKNVEAEIAGKEVIVEVVYSENSKYYYPKPNGNISGVDGKELSEDAKRQVLEYMNLAGLAKIRQSDKKAYQNKMLFPEKLKVLFFESAPYKGLPSEIPFDVENGWYVEMSYVLGGFGKPYDDSGKVSHFYICNVGENGLIEFKKSADDICRYYTKEVGDSTFPGLTAEESRVLLEKAQRAIVEAGRQYGKSKITINGKTFDSGISFSGDDGLCTDFMSASDCTLLFNVCDPVICPASRCDFGGKYRVDNVIQSGVAGSLLLCLPNYKEGVAVPICLSGVHAGLESYASILNSTVECLNESITTGQTVGICDEIKSIYLCEFFWRQAAPLAQVALSNLFDSFSGSHGGAEYLTIHNAWDNTQNAMNYFTQVYAINSVKAFGNRNIDDAGTEGGVQICKSFASVNFGDFKNFFNTLIQPDSPVQFSAWFSENPMTTATIPPISHYKVYYHIYAGKDMGSYYVVYLKDVAATTGVNTLGSYIVDRGYINRGSQVDKARDFTATSGFKQLCINVNGQDNCGFGKVSTSYALNSLSEQFVAEEVAEHVTTESACVAGTPSLGSLLTPNLEAGVDEVINPQLYNKGIIRVCSSENPGKQVLPSGSGNTNSGYTRWEEVGYCDDPSIKCWLDTQSVKEVIRDKGLEEDVLNSVDSHQIEEGNYLTYQESKSIGDRAQDFIDEFSLREDDTRESISDKIRMPVSDLTTLSQIGITNTHRARAHHLLGKLYKKITEQLWEGVNEDDFIVWDSWEVFDEFEEGSTGETTSTTPGTTQTPSASDTNVESNPVDTAPVLYTLDANNNIVDTFGESGYSIQENTYDAVVVRSIFEKRDLFGMDIMYPDREVGLLLNNQITFNVDENSWTDTMKQLNELHFDEKTRSFYRNNEQGGSGLSVKSQKYSLDKNGLGIISLTGERTVYDLEQINSDNGGSYIIRKVLPTTAETIHRVVYADVGILTPTQNVNLKTISFTVPASEWDTDMRALNGLTVDLVNYKIY